LGGRKPWPG